MIDQTGRDGSRSSLPTRMDTRELARLIDPDGRLQNGGAGRIRVRCPGHPDKSPSLNVWIDDDGKAALNCFAGCDQDRILGGLDHHIAEQIRATWGASNVTVLLPRRRHTPTAPTQPATPRVEAEYPYVNENGELAYLVRRYPGKKIRQFHPNENGEIIKGRGPHTLIPYRLPDVLAANRAGDTIYIVEGEKDADTLASHGITATTNVGGAGKWTENLNGWFAGAHIIILPDNDQPGRDHATQVRDHLHGVAETVRIVELPDLPEKGDVTDWLEERTVEQLEELVRQDETPKHPYRLVRGGDFLYTQEHDLTPIWGDGQDILWAAGEPFVITAKAGVGKTTLAHQTVLRRIGILDTDLLGYPIQPDERPVLYIAADRPRQIARSFLRMTKAKHQDTLNELLVIHDGYLPHMLDQRPDSLLELAEITGCGTIYIDSLKDVASEIDKPASATQVNAAIQLVIREGVEVVVLHHQRKAGSGNRKPKTIDDLYGGGQVAWGAGSVIVLWGEPTDPNPELIHLKKPAEEIGPFTIEVDWETGTVTRDSGSEIDAVTWVHQVNATSTNGATARNYAIRLFGSAGAVERRLKKRAARMLDREVERGYLAVTKRDIEGQETKVYRPVVEPPK